MSFEKIIKNIIKGLPEGIISIVLFFTNGLFFGMNNSIIAIYMTLTFNNMRKNIYIESNSFKNYLIHLSLGIFASIATENIFFAIIINFLVASIYSYFLTREYDSSRYFVFLLGFVLMQLIPINLNQIYLRVLSITYSYLIIRIVLKIFYKNRLSKNIYKLINKSFVLIGNGLDYAKNGDSENFKLEEDKLSNTLEELNRNILESYEKVYFYLIIIFGQFNNLNKRILVRRDLAKENIFLIDRLRDVLDSSDEIKSSEDLVCFSKKIGTVLENSKGKSTFNNCLTFMFEYIVEASSKITICEKNNFNKKIFSFDINKFFNRFRNIKIDGYRGRFSIRIGILLSIGFGLNKIFEFPKEYWLPLSIYVMAFPYYEDSNKRIRERIIGTIFGLIASFIIFYIFRTKIEHRIIIGLATIFMFSIDSYVTKSIYTTIYAMAITSFTMNPDEAMLLRFLYTFLGAFIALLGNKLIFPNRRNYEIKKSINELTLIDKNLLENINNVDKETLFSFIRNTYLNNKKIDKLINEKEKIGSNIKDLILINNEFINDLVYIYILANSEEKKEVNEKILNDIFITMRKNLDLNSFIKKSFVSKNLDLNEFIMESFKKEESVVNKLKKDIIPFMG